MYDNIIVPQNSKGLCCIPFEFKARLAFTVSCVLCRINLDRIIFLKNISSNPNQRPTSPQTAVTKMRESPTYLGLEQLPIMNQQSPPKPHISWGGGVGGGGGGVGVYFD